MQGPLQVVFGPAQPRRCRQANIGAFPVRFLSQDIRQQEVEFGLVFIPFQQVAILDRRPGKIPHSFVELGQLIAHLVGVRLEGQDPPVGGRLPTGLVRLQVEKTEVAMQIGPLGVLRRQFLKGGQGFGIAAGLQQGVAQKEADRIFAGVGLE